MFIDTGAVQIHSSVGAQRGWNTCFAPTELALLSALGTYKHSAPTEPGPVESVGKNKLCGSLCDLGDSTELHRENPFSDRLRWVAVRFDFPTFPRPTGN